MVLAGEKMSKRIKDIQELRKILKTAGKIDFSGHTYPATNIKSGVSDDLDNFRNYGYFPSWRTPSKHDDCIPYTPIGGEWVKPPKPSKYDPHANDDNEAQRLINELEQREKELKKKEKKLKKEQEDFKVEQEKLEAERKKIAEEKARLEKERADLEERRKKIEDDDFKKSELGELIT
jgi:DNA repair exonuclease SbcCD ATPase subunit